MSTTQYDSTSTRASTFSSKKSPTNTTSQSQTMDTANSSDSNIPIRSSKRRRGSISQSTTSDNPSIATSRPRRQAAIASRSQVKSQSRLQPKSNRTSKSSSKAKAQSRKVEAMEEEEEDEEEEFECPCGRGCDTISDCEKRRKEVMGRDVGMSIILSSTGVVNIMVGASPNQQTFLIHKELLAIHSDCFASVFASQRKASISSISTSSTALEEALTGAMRGTHLGAGIGLTNQSPRGFGVNKCRDVEVKKEAAENDQDDSDDEFTMISSDQYYYNLSKKRLPTPRATPTKPKLHSQFQHRASTTSASSPSPFIANLIARAKAAKPTPSLSPTPAPAPALNSSSTANISTISTHFPTIQPLPFSLFTSYIYTGTLTPSLLALSDTADTCTWEKLWALGYKLRARGFMNYCMEGLRALERVHEGNWPSAKEARIVWGLDLTPLNVDSDSGLGFEVESAGGRDVFSNDSSTNPKMESPIENPAKPELESSPSTTHPIEEPKTNPLKLFTASCIAHLSPLTHHPKTSLDYRNWERTLKDEALSLAVHEVDIKVFGAKKPWDDEFRGMWKVEEEGLEERWRGVLEGETTKVGKGENRNEGEYSGVKEVEEVEERAKKGDVLCALKMMGLKGKEWAKGLKGEEDESDESGESGDEEFGVNVDDGDGEEDEDEYIGGRGGRGGRKRARR